MADSILGLPSSAKFAAEGDRFYNHRRKILHIAPQGGASLTGLLSMIPQEPVNDTIYYWYEQRFKSNQAALRGTNPITTDAPSNGDSDTGSAASAGATAVTLLLYIKVDTTRDLRVGQVIAIDTDPNIQFIIQSVVRGVSSEALKGYISVKLVRAVTFGTIATYFPATTVIRVIGSAYGEGQSGVGVNASAFKRPYAMMNTTQIFRDPLTFPGTVLQLGLKYDETGPYRQKARQVVLDHFVGLEKSLIFGKRSTTTRPSFDSGQEDLTVRTFSGIYEFLELWDAGATGLTIDGATYAPYSFKSASTLDTDDQKRIITNTAGTFTVDKWNMWAERVSRYRTNKTNEKLVLMGSGAMLAMHKMFRNNTSFQVSYNDKAYGLEFHQLKTPSGIFNLVTHPLFNEDVNLRYSALITDIWSLKTRPMVGRDTKLLPNRQNPGDDFRKDEYLTEMGFELWAPEQHMFIKNLREYVTSE